MFGGKPAPVPADAKITAEPLAALDCGRFSDFWTTSR